ncbi:MAG: GNAT family N-acetyltransferase [Solirubrobacteraceae bacterium]
MIASERRPERLVGPDRLLLRRWIAADTEVLAVAVAGSLEHLRPWMPWVAQEPLSLQRRRAMIEEWEQDWLRGGDVVMGAFVGARVAGGCGLHRRIGCSGLEIGYWTHPAFLRTGIAKKAVAMLTDASFALPGITRVEIHHARANEASAGIPRTLGYRLIAQVADEPQAPGEIGVECRWRITREQWASSGP